MGWRHCWPPAMASGHTNTFAFASSHAACPTVLAAFCSHTELSVPVHPPDKACCGCSQSACTSNCSSVTTRSELPQLGPPCHRLLPSDSAHHWRSTS
ncbi:hypothetical protein BHE74_00023138 [Ensete ventricosum]|uniref:Uncharacterized protein n=1 Tax=Ensete ventricosum TaxID=4639 RepID=A0A444E5V2_ENSVE|nr:hypothetical protein B296_00003380 [Ensete ventricosum]RWW05742.1 hypothetical protein GW17_00030968 [Ensete ventricosum]RWW69276.1 hypothetical protein BHE74_00023138 [Ensete ventricosum]RZS02241.1 hypothetical protein BHM03_00032246 [Ensete ventricosum]